MGGQSLRRDELQLPGLPQVAEGVVAGHHLALACRQTGNLRVGFLQQCVQARQVGIAALEVDIEVGRVQFAKCLGDIAHIDFGIGEALPRMRVKNRLAIFIQHQRNNARAGVDPLALGFAAGQQALQPRLEAQPIGDDQVGTQQRLGVVRAGLVDMSIGIGIDQVGEFDMIATHLAGQVGEDAEARHHLQFFSGLQ